MSTPSESHPFSGFLRRAWREWIRPVGLMALLIFSFRSAIADWNDVPTGSMKPTILVGERIVVNRLAYDLKVPFTTWHVAEWSAPARGEVIVLNSPADGIRMVKRVVGLPGDRIELRDNRVRLNGEEVEYLPFPQAQAEALPGPELVGRVLALERLGDHTHPVAALPARSAVRSFAEVTVPAGHYFVMGDNRDDSFDSRFFGMVPRAAVLGRAVAVAASLDPEQHYAPRWNRWLKRLP